MRKVMAVVKKEPIAGIYARVSTKDQSCAAQLNELRLWAERSGVTVFGEYVDHKHSGRKASRPEFDRLMADARAKRFNIILVYKLDRFGRSVLHLTRNLKELDELGVRFIATSQGLDIDGKNSVGKLVLHILAAVAEFESDIIGERVSFGLAKRRRAGHRLAGCGKTKQAA